jgi:hypothetical protein
MKWNSPTTIGYYENKWQHFWIIGQLVHIQLVIVNILYIYINDIGGITGKYEPIVIFHGYVKYIDICKRIWILSRVAPTHILFVMISTRENGSFYLSTSILDNFIIYLGCWKQPCKGEQLPQKKFRSGEPNGFPGKWSRANFHIAY